MKAGILTVGDELLNGQTIDTNATWLGTELNNIGISVITKMSVGDNRDDMIMALDFMFDKTDLVIVTGGLGPTKDDITKDVLVEYFQDKLVFDQPSFDHISSYFKAWGRKPLEVHRLQCYMPSTAELIKNNRGTAPGMWFESNGKYLLSMPGVPSEMKGIMEEAGLDKMAVLNPNMNIEHYVIQTAGMGETMAAEKIADIVEEFPSTLSMAYLPGTASVKLRVTGKGTNAEQLNHDVAHFGKRIVDRLGHVVVGIGTKTLEQVIGEIAKAKDLKIGTAESCTGGLIANKITSVSGSSAYFKGSIVAYANEIKEHHLNVASQTLADHGAVSEATVTQMVTGLIDRLGVDVAISVSGVAGPTGGSPEKPVGTIWIAVGDKTRTVTRKLQLVKNRELNIQYSATVALNQLRLFMIGEL